MPLTDYPFKAGIYSEATDREVGKFSYWKDCNHVRFFNGHPQKIGGWVKAATDPFIGKARAVIDWATEDKASFIAIGTHRKLYVYSAGALADITPFRSSGSLTNPFDTTASSAVVTVTDTGHLCEVGDFVHYADATAVGGITVDGEYEVTEVLTADTYTITHSSAATSTANGGGTVAYDYEITTGVEVDVPGLGWGVSVWGDHTWGTPRPSSDFILHARIWSFGIWGNDLLASPFDGPIFVWDSSAGLVNNRATLIAEAPITNKAIFVSQDARQIFAIGAHDGADSDALLIRWCSQEDYTDWTPTLSNTAGDKRIALGNELVGAFSARSETLIFTNTAVYSATFTGPPDIYGFQPLGKNGGVMGPRAITVFNGVCYWMSVGGFYRYDGTITELVCSVYSHIFDDINLNLTRLIHATAIANYSEIIWFYVSKDAFEVDRYVIYNTAENIWYYGTLERTSFEGSLQSVLHVYGCSPDGYLYWHERGFNDDASAMESYLYSGDIEFDASGNEILRISKFIADMLKLTGTVQVTFSGKKYPQDIEVQESGPHDISPTTNYVNPRMRGRQVSFQLYSNTLNAEWSLGTVRIDANPDGKR